MKKHEIEARLKKAKPHEPKPSGIERLQVAVAHHRISTNPARSWRHPEPTASVNYLDFWRGAHERGLDVRILPAEVEREGLTVAEFAKWLGVDRRRLARELIEIPTGPAPALPPGKIPVRRVGGVRRIFIADFQGQTSNRGVQHDRVETKATKATDRKGWRGQIDHLRSA